MRLVKFTNFVDGRQGDPLYINVDQITAVYEDQTPSGGIVTKIFGGSTGLLWSVEESLHEVIKIIKADDILIPLINRD